MWTNKLQCREKVEFFNGYYFTSIVKKKLLMTILLHKKSNSQYNKGSFISFFFQNTQIEFNYSDLCRHFFTYLQNIKYYKHTQKTDNAFGIRCKEKSNGLYVVVTVKISTVSDITVIQHSH